MTEDALEEGRDFLFHTVLKQMFSIRSRVQVIASHTNVWK